MATEISAVATTALYLFNFMETIEDWVYKYVMHSNKGLYSKSSVDSCHCLYDVLLLPIMYFLYVVYVINIPRS